VTFDLPRSNDRLTASQLQEAAKLTVCWAQDDARHVRGELRSKQRAEHR